MEAARTTSKVNSEQAWFRGSALNFERTIYVLFVRRSAKAKQVLLLLLVGSTKFRPAQIYRRCSSRVATTTNNDKKAKQQLFPTMSAHCTRKQNGHIRVHLEGAQGWEVYLLSTTVHDWSFGCVKLG
jgi:hypothetical protein